MKKYLVVILLLNVATICHAQEATIVNQGFNIINNEKVIKNDMILYGELDYPKSKKPLYMINGKEFYTIANYFDRDDFKKITVLQPAEGLAKFGKKGKNGVIMLELKDDVTEPYIEIVTNKVYYKCRINGQFTDTSKKYFDDVHGTNCSILDLRSDPAIPLIYIGFDNEIKIKHLGAGWDVIMLSMAGGTISGSGGNRVIRVQKEGNVKLTLNVNGKEKTFMIKAVPLPAAKPQ